MTKRQADTPAAFSERHEIELRIFELQTCSFVFEFDLEGLITFKGLDEQVPPLLCSLRTISDQVDENLRQDTRVCITRGQFFEKIQYTRYLP